MPPTGGIYFSPPPCYTVKKHERVNLMKKTVLRITAVLTSVLLLAILIPACLIAGSMNGQGGKR